MENRLSGLDSKHTLQSSDPRVATLQLPEAPSDPRRFAVASEILSQLRRSLGDKTSAQELALQGFLDYIANHALQDPIRAETTVTGNVKSQNDVTEPA